METDIMTFGRKSFVTWTKGLKEEEMTDQLLTVLDMSEDEQVEYFYIKGYRQLVDTFPAGGLRIKYDENNNIISVNHSHSKLRFDRKALADLAFRLRDEAVDLDGTGYLYMKAVDAVQKKVEGVDSLEGDEPDCRESHDYLLCRVKPIDMIIATIKAKELAKK